jgi:hypothetical protein
MTKIKLCTMFLVVLSVSLFAQENTWRIMEI